MKSDTMKVNVAVVGATGNVGRNVLSILSERNFPINKLYALASNSSIGQELPFGHELIKVEALENFDFKKADIAIFSAGSSISSKYAVLASQAGCICIDNTSYFRMHSDVPLVIPEINFKSTGDAKIIANPNCIVVPLAMVLNELRKHNSIKRVIVSTYQSVAGAGKDGICELHEQTQNLVDMETISPKKFAKQIAFNVIPFIDTLEENGFTKEENKIRAEVKKILNDETEVVATCVRVPVFVGHSISVNIEFNDNVSINEVIKLLNNAEGIIVTDEITTPAECAGKDAVYVSRIRKDPSIENGLCMWIVSDNVRKGAALNAVQIAELLLKNK